MSPIDYENRSHEGHEDTKPTKLGLQIASCPSCLRGYVLLLNYCFCASMTFLSSSGISGIGTWTRHLPSGLRLIMMLTLLNAAALSG